MKQVFQFQNNKEYWNDRWANTGHDSDQFISFNIYPIKYAEMVMKDPVKKVIELGTGLGRVLKHYYMKGYDIELYIMHPVLKHIMALSQRKLIKKGVNE